MTIRTVLIALTALIAVLALDGCGQASHPAAATATSTTTVGSSTTPAPGAATTTTSPSRGPATTSTPGAAAAQNLTVTADIRAQLLAAGAQSHGLPASDFTGLRPGETYYAYDPSTKTYWAAAGLVPSPSSYQAGVSSQDDGAYLLYQRPAGGAWKVFDIGLAGVGGTPCTAGPPSAVVAVWGWPAPGCRPARI